LSLPLSNLVNFCSRSESGPMTEDVWSVDHCILGSYDISEWCTKNSPNFVLPTVSDS